MDFIKLFWTYIVKQILYRYRKQIFLTGTALFLFLWIGSSAGYFRLPFSRINAFEAISKNTPIIVETRNYKKALEQVQKMAYYNDLMAISLAQKWEHGLNRIDSLLKTTKNYSKLLEKAHIVSAAQVVSNKNANWLYALENYEENIKEGFDIQSFITELNPQKNLFNTYRGRTIHTLEFSNQISISVAVFSGLILISTETILVESGIEQLDNIALNVQRNNDFLRAQKAVGTSQDAVVLYVNFEFLPSLTAVISEPNPRAIMGLTKLGTWQGFDLRFLEKGFLANGHFYPGAENLFLQKLALQEAPQNSQIAHYIPKNLGVMLYLGWNDFKTFYNSYQTQENQDFETYFLPWIGQDIALVIEDPTDDENAFAKDKLVIVHSRDTFKTKMLLQKYAQQFGKLDKMVYQNFEITQIAANAPLQALFGEYINPLQNPYFIMVDNYIIFANSLASLEGWIKSYNTGQMILKLPEYQSFFSQLQKQSNIYVLLSTPNSAKFLQYFVRAEWDEYISQSFSKFRNIYPIGIQFFAFKKHFMLNLSANYNIVKTVETNRATVAWEADLAATSAITPQVVRSHDGNYYIFAQDAKKRLYFFDKNGENLWSNDKVLPALINSQVFEVDFYDNDEIQYAFSTLTHIHILDKTGLEIKKIPLANKAANGLLAVDYGKGPRFFIACQNGKVYAYEQNGKPLSGWQPLAGAGAVHFPMKHLNFKDKRYFLMLSKSGNCQAYNIAGTPYFKGGNLGNGITTWGIDDEIGRIVAGNSNGKIQIMNHLGKSFGFSPLKGMTEGVNFVYADIIGDGRKDYIRISEDKMAVHYYEKEKNKKGKEKDVLKEAGIYNLIPAKRQAFEVQIVGKEKNMIGFLEPENGTVLLFNAQGQLQNGFPLAGTSKFTIVDLFGEGGNSLVVANRDKICAYKLKI